MNTFFLFSLNTFLTLIEVVALFLLASSFFPIKTNNKSMFLSLILLIALIIVSYYVSNEITLLKLGLIMLMDSMWIYYAFRKHFIISIGIAVLFVSLLTVCDSVFLMVFRSISGYDAKVYLNNPYAYYAFCYSAKTFELFLIICLRQIIKYRTTLEKANWQDWARTIIFPAMSVLISAFLMQIYLVENSVAFEIMVCSIVLIIADILAIILLNYLERQQEKIRDYSMLKHSFKQEQDNLNAWMTAYENQRKQTHEFQNQLHVIKGLAQGEPANTELISYLDKLLQNDLSDSLFVKTGRPVVDVILNQKHSLAQSKNIQFQVYLDDLSNFALPDDALVVVLSNLIDNALEACEKITDPAQRVIKINMKSTPEVCLLYIENTCADAVEIINNQVVSSKSNPIEHGYGLKNIATILQAHQAIYAIEYVKEQRLFCFSAQIIPQVEE